MSDAHMRLPPPHPLSEETSRGEVFSGGVRKSSKESGGREGGRQRGGGGGAEGYTWKAMGEKAAMIETKRTWTWAMRMMARSLVIWVPKPP